MKTLWRLTLIIIVFALVATGLYFFFENPSVQQWLGLEAGSGRGRRLEGTALQVSPAWEDRSAQETHPELRSNGNGRDGLGLGRGRNSGRGKGFGLARYDQGKGYRAATDPLINPSGWLGPLNTFLRLALFLAGVVVLVKLGQWIKKKATSASAASERAQAG